MTAFTRTWNVAYEALPPDGESAGNGAERINETKADVRERLAVDHSIAGDSEDGTHKQVTFTDPLAAKPVQELDNTYIYTKDASGTSELFFEDESGSEVQLTGAGKLFIDLVYPVGAIYSSTVSTTPATLFGGTWVALADKQMLVQQGTYAAGTTGGSSTAVVVSHGHTDTFAVAADGAHNHNAKRGSGAGSNNSHYASGGSSEQQEAAHLVAVGTHTHGLTGAVGSEGVSGANANMPPYLSVYMWKRTA